MIKYVTEITQPIWFNEYYNILNNLIDRAIVDERTFYQIRSTIEELRQRLTTATIDADELDIYFCAYYIKEFSALLIGNFEGFGKRFRY